MWTVRVSGVPEHDTHSVVSINGKVYSFGTYNAPGTRNSREVVDVFSFDPATYRWDMVQRRSPPEIDPNDNFRHKAVAYGDCAYLLIRPLNQDPRIVLHRFDARTLTWSRPEVSGEGPTLRFDHIPCMVSHRMYIVRDLDGNDMEFLDLATMEWHHVVVSGEVPVGCFFDIAIVIGTRIYVCARTLTYHFPEGNFERTDSLYYLETTTHTWVRPIEQDSPMQDREGCSAFVYKSEIYIFGGYSLLRRTHLADVHKYNPETSCWTEVKPWGSGPSGRVCHGCSTTGERVFVFGGSGPLRYHLQGEVAEMEAALTDLHILHLAPTLQNLCLLAVTDARLDISDWPSIFRKMVNAITSRDS